MNLPKFRSGQEINSTLLNQLSDGIRRNQITSVIGGTFTSTPGGTAIVIDAQTRGGGGSTAVCPFQVTTANVGDTWKFSIAWGMVGVPPVLPIGMLPNNVPPLTMPFLDGWVYMQVEFVTDDTAVFQSAPPVRGATGGSLTSKGPSVTSSITANQFVALPKRAAKRLLNFSKNFAQTT